MRRTCALLAVTAALTLGACTDDEPDTAAVDAALEQADPATIVDAVADEGVTGDQGDEVRARLDAVLDLAVATAGGRGGPERETVVEVGEALWEDDGDATMDAVGAWVDARMGTVFALPEDERQAAATVLAGELGPVLGALSDAADGADATYDGNDLSPEDACREPGTIARQLTIDRLVDEGMIDGDASLEDQASEVVRLVGDDPFEDLLAACDAARTGDDDAPWSD